MMIKAVASSNLEKKVRLELLKIWKKNKETRLLIKKTVCLERKQYQNDLDLHEFF